MNIFHWGTFYASTHHFNELKELNDGWVEEVVSGAIVQQGINDRLKQVPFDDVAVVILILQTNDPAHETQGTLDKNRDLSKFKCNYRKTNGCVCESLWLTKSQEGVFWVHEHQHSPEQVFVHDVGLDVICVVLHTEGQKLQDQCQQLSRLEVVYTQQTAELIHPDNMNECDEACNFFKHQLLIYAI